VRLTTANLALIDVLGFTEAAIQSAADDLATLVPKAVREYQDVPWGTVAKKPYIGTSGGKDSVVIMWLSDMVEDAPLPVVHTPKPGVTHPKTLEFLYKMTANRRILFCPARDHASLGYDTQIDGTRISEYNRTDGRSTDFVRNGQNVSRLEMTMWVPNGLFGLNFVYPIYDWEDVHVWACIIKHNIPFSEEYLCLGV